VVAGWVSALAVCAGVFPNTTGGSLQTAAIRSTLRLRMELAETGFDSPEIRSIWYSQLLSQLDTALSQQVLSLLPITLVAFGVAQQICGLYVLGLHAIHADTVLDSVLPLHSQQVLIRSQHATALVTKVLPPSLQLLGWNRAWAACVSLEAEGCSTRGRDCAQRRGYTQQRQSDRSTGNRVRRRVHISTSAGNGARDDAVQ
jgi:hypothetical protein